MYDTSRSVTAGKNSYPASGCSGIFRPSLRVSGQWVMFSLVGQDISGANVFSMEEDLWALVTGW